MPKLTKRADGKDAITWDEYRATHKDFKDVWTSNWGEPGQRDLLGRRTCLTYEHGTALAIEGRSLVIVGAPRAHRLMLDQDRSGFYVLEHLDDEGEWVQMGFNITPDAAGELVKVQSMGDVSKRNWRITYKEKAGEG